MAKQIYIDENGNENLVSGTINTGKLLPMSTTEPNSMVADRIEACETAISGKQNKINGSYITTGIVGVTGVSIDEGGYYKIGNLVIMNMRISIANAVTGKV